MTPIKCARIERIPGVVPPSTVPGHSWYATQVEHVSGLGQWTTWALVPDESPASSPTEADIARRVELLQEACVVTLPPVAVSDGCAGLARNVTLSGPSSSYWMFYGGKWACSTASDHDLAIRAEAIRQLLAERGAR